MVGAGEALLFPESDNLTWVIRNKQQQDNCAGGKILQQPPKWLFFIAPLQQCQVAVFNKARREGAVEGGKPQQVAQIQRMTLGSPKDLGACTAVP